MTWQRLRIAILLMILLIVGLSTWLDRVYTTDWTAPLGVALHPISADDSPISRAYVAALATADFADIEKFFRDEARHHGVALDEPVRLWLAPPPGSRPPLVEPGASVLEAMAYALRLRWHAWRTLAGQPGPTPHVRMYLLYHDPAVTPVVPHSLGLARGLIGVVHLFAAREMHGSNQVVLAHEILHTLGATDKYRLADGQPLHPDGFAEPGRQPLYPQSHAEVMGGRIPLSDHEAMIPASLDAVVVGHLTAREIRWLP